jgi:hypothetical protein
VQQAASADDAAVVPLRQAFADQANAAREAVRAGAAAAPARASERCVPRRRVRARRSFEPCCRSRRAAPRATHRASALRLSPAAPQAREAAGEAADDDAGAAGCAALPRLALPALR